MKTNLCICVLSMGMLIPACLMATPFQDLSRVNDIVNQARGLADSVRGGAGQPLQQSQFGQATAQVQTHPNPFSVNPQASSVVISNPVMSTPDIAYQSSTGTGVSVTGSNIQISAGGKQFNIPRIGGASVGVPSGSGMISTSNVTGHLNNINQRIDAYRSFANAVSTFKEADFSGAVQHMRVVTQQLPDQVAFNQFNSLAYFASGDYARAAEYAYATSAAAPLWNWQQIQAYYGNADQYAQQYSQLQRAASQADANASVRFLLGYHHLMLGHRDHAQQQFESVLRAIPNDPVTQGLLEMTRQAPPSPSIR